MALAGARGLLMSGQTEGQGAHARDKERFQDISCLIYGASPEAYAKRSGGKPPTPERAKACAARYPRVEAAWLTLLKPHFRFNKSEEAQPAASKGTKAKATVSCAPVVDHVMETLLPLYLKTLSASERAEFESNPEAAKLIRDEGLHHCRKDAWSQPLRACILKAKDLKEMEGCEE